MSHRFHALLCIWSSVGLGGESAELDAAGLDMSNRPALLTEKFSVHSVLFSNLKLNSFALWFVQSLRENDIEWTRFTKPWRFTSCDQMQTQTATAPSLSLSLCMQTFLLSLRFFQWSGTGLGRNTAYSGRSFSHCTNPPVLQEMLKKYKRF